MLVIGEAVKRISPDTRSLAPDVPWKQVAGMRDRLVHDYFNIIPDQVWNTAFTDVPRLRDEVVALMKRLEVAVGSWRVVFTRPWPIKGPWSSAIKGPWSYAFQPPPLCPLSYTPSSTNQQGPGDEPDHI